MKRREIFEKNMNHEETGYVLVDLGKHIGSIHKFGYDRLKKIMPEIEFEKENQILDRMAQTVVLNEDLLKEWDIDFRWLHPNINALMTDVSDTIYEDMWGVGFKAVEDYWAPEYSPMSKWEEEDFDKLESYNWPDPNDPRLFDGMNTYAEDLYKNTDYIIGADGLKNGLLMTALQMRGYEQFMMDLSEEPEFVEALLDKILDITKKMWTNYLKDVKEYVQIVYLTDDYGTQTSMLISPNAFREWIQPRNKELIDHIKGIAPHVKIMFHTDGSILPILDDLIESGVDILNPVQTSTEGLHDTVALKEKYGDRICFHGAIDVQKVLPNGTPESIKEEVRKRMLELGSNGGYICAACHNIGHDINEENIKAMYEAAKEFKTTLFKA
ncbi:hypothetical protein J0B03_07610 [Alkalibacter rhizosphaerae]|uniref:Uroporphyrinogen decarboxylase (URO-D) domain-containing protein n=1 Tax=Alkalibacter rhizosphaerae TaxID=2815577 RepID=A0A974XG62_9FIRM|nr:uroporphyrinogen decarboxylase family protein [Alkalibacter rhizosphaerae]QSX07698.1 hypothetical protein J0B03_07610 [Alkalibacter rhizosphaerae]